MTVDRRFTPALVFVSVVAIGMLLGGAWVTARCGDPEPSLTASAPETVEARLLAEFAGSYEQDVPATGEVRELDIVAAPAELPLLGGKPLRVRSSATRSSFMAERRSMSEWSRSTRASG